MQKNNKILLRTLLIGLLIMLVACGPNASEQVADDASPPTSAPLPTAEPAATDAPEPTDEPAPTDAPVEDAEMEEEEVVMEDSAETNQPTASNSEFSQPDNRSDRLRSLTATWNTDWTLRTIEYDSVLSGGPPRDGIPSIDAPSFISFDEANDWLVDNEPVISLEINGDARAYPLQILTWHEIANDVVGDTPVIVTFCPLCNSAIVFEAVVNGQPTEFGVSGLLRNSDMIMYDRQTESLWQQFTGEGIVGEQTGNVLPFLASGLISYADFKNAYPEGVVLSRNTGLNRQYGRNPYAGYDTIGNTPFLFDGESDARLDAVERVVTVSLPDEQIDIAYPLPILSEAGAINDVQGGRELVVFHLDGTSSALGASEIANGTDVGATGVFDPTVDGQTLTFRQDDGIFVDEQTGTLWNIVGQAVEGELVGKQLDRIVHADHFWFSWAAFKPDTIIYQP